MRHRNAVQSSPMLQKQVLISIGLTPIVNFFMKQLYSIALAVAVSLSASAQVLTSPQQATAKVAATCQFKQAHKLDKSIRHLTKAPAKVAAQTADVAGDYDVAYSVFLKGATDYAGEMTVVEGYDANSLIFHFPFENGTSLYTLDITGTLDATTGAITFSSNQSSGFTGASIVFEHWDTSASAWQVISEITATYTGTEITFDTDDAIALSADDGSGSYTFMGEITMTKIVEDPNADPNEGWTSLGKAKFVDPWVTPALGGDQWETEYEVELQQNDADKNTYRLVDPYKDNFPYAHYNTSTAKHGYIQFNISDPDHVYFDVVEAGFADEVLEISRFYPYNSLGWAIYYFDADPSTVVAVLGDDLIYTTYKDGVINLGSRQEEDPDSQETYTAYDACFGDQEKIGGGYTWTDADMTGRITFPDAAGITDMEIEAPEAKTVYYNLQGIRISEPANGVFIKVQGNKAAKVIK